jgi:sulfur carrier protein ThiS
MTAILRLGASLKTLINGKDEYTVEAGITVRESLRNQGINPDLIALVTVNGMMQNKDYIIKETDIVRLMAVIGGG